MDYFFLCGAPKSGTTWLQRMLDAHPAVACGGEGHFIEMIAAPMAKLAGEFATKMKSVNDFIYDGEGSYQGFRRDDVIAMTRLGIERLMHRHASEKTLWLGDKTPRYFEYLGDLNLLFPDCRIIQLVRDPRDVAVSLLYHAKRRGVEGVGVKSAPQRAKVMIVAATRWLQAQKLCAQFQARNPHRYIELSYEDLIADAAVGIGTVAQEFKIDHSPQLLAHIVEITSFKRSTGREPGQGDAQAFIRKGIAGDWRNELYEDDLERIGSMLGPWMERKGYAPSAGK